MQYVGKSETPFNLRLKTYRHRVKSTASEKVLPVEEHVRLPHHDFSIHAKFIIIEQIENSSLDNITVVLETHKDTWILRLKTLHPDSLNSKLNHQKNYLPYIYEGKWMSHIALVQLLFLHRLPVAYQHIKIFQVLILRQIDS